MEKALSDSQVAAILSSPKSVSREALSRQFGVGTNTIYRILAGKTYKRIYEQAGYRIMDIERCLKSLPDGHCPTIFFSPPDYQPTLDYQQWQRRILKQCARVAGPSGVVLYQHKNRMQEKELKTPLDWIRIPELTLRAEIVWVEGEQRQADGESHPDIPSLTQRIWVLAAGHHWHVPTENSKAVRKWGDVWAVNRADMLAMAIKLGYGRVFNPFAREGEILLAARQAGREYLGCGVNLAERQAFLDGIQE